MYVELQLFVMTDPMVYNLYAFVLQMVIRNFNALFDFVIIDFQGTNGLVCLLLRVKTYIAAYYTIFITNLTLISRRFLSKYL